MCRAGFERALVERVGDVPIARETRIFSPSAVAMPALSWPRCCSAYKPEVREVGRLGVPEDAEDAALVFELVSMYPYATPFEVCSSAVDQTCSARTATSIVFARRDLERDAGGPIRAGTPAAAAGAESSCFLDAHRHDDSRRRLS
jgi:hypothetical protein